MKPIPTWASNITWAKSMRCVGFLLFHGALCIVLSIAISALEMAIYMASKGPNSTEEFVGMYLVVGLLFGQFSCVAASPVYLLAYCKTTRQRAHRIAAAASVVASVGVWLFFRILGS